MATHLTIDMRDLDERLICAVRERPQLWDPLHAAYRERTVVESTWQEVATMVGMENAKLAKIRWRNIRDVFVRTRKKIMTDTYLMMEDSDGLIRRGNNTSRGGKYDHLLDFLLKFVNHRHQRTSTDVQNFNDIMGNYQHSTEEGEQSNGNTIDQQSGFDCLESDSTDMKGLYDSICSRTYSSNNNNNNNNNPLLQPLSSSSSLIPPPPLLPPLPPLTAAPAPQPVPQPSSSSSQPNEITIKLENGRRTNSSSSATINNHVESLQTNALLYNLSQLHNNMMNDVDELFGRYIVMSLRELPNKLRAETRLKIQQVIYDAQMTNLN